jgi:uncharacterized protein (DUF169 family)
MSETMDHRTLEHTLTSVLDLRQRPVAIALCDVRPDGVAEFEGTEPAGCSFWRLAAGGKRFATRPVHHANCAIGAHTHNIPLPPERAGDLDDTLTLMTGIGYIRMDEVPGIPRLPATPKHVVYSPLGDSPVAPDVVIVVGRPGRVMLLQEAALHAGASARVPLAGRPTCMAIPIAAAGGVIVSSACVGNRVYTDIGEDELYVAIPGKDLVKIVEALRTIVAANATLANYHRGRRAALETE